MSIFTGQKGLRHQYAALTTAQLAAANNATNAVLLLKFDNVGRLVFLDNTMDKDLSILLVHPDADSTVVANRLFWFELPTNRVMNYDMNMSPGLFFDPGTTIWVYSAVAPTTGKLRVTTWG